MTDPLAYHITWTTYASRLPGDERTWVKKDVAKIQPGNKPLEEHAGSLAEHGPIALDAARRDIVTQTIRDHCRIRGWTLHAVNVRRITYMLWCRRRCILTR